MNLCLGIDTTGHGGAVALADADTVIGRELHDPSLGYAEELFGLIDRMLQVCGRERDDIGRIAVVQGPGSFTGLRIGVMTAKTIAFARGLPLIAAGTLPLVAACEGADRRLAVSEAGGGNFWCAGYSDEGRQEVRPVERVTPAELLEVFEGLGAPDVAVHGKSLVPRVEDALGRTSSRIGVVEDLAGRLALLAARGQAPTRIVDVETLMPDYVSVSQAERVHGVDLREEIARPIEPKGWT